MQYSSLGGIFDSKNPGRAEHETPKTRIQTGLDLSGGARALIKPVNATISASDING